MKSLFAIPLLLAASLSHAELRKVDMEVVCGPTEEIVSTIKNKYKENVTWVGKESDNVVISMWSNKDKSTFSILKTSVNGKVTCMISAGETPTAL